MKKNFKDFTDLELRVKASKELDEEITKEIAAAAEKEADEFPHIGDVLDANAFFYDKVGSGVNVVWEEPQK